MNDSNLKSNKYSLGHYILIFILILFVGLTFLPIGSIIIGDVQSRIDEYNNILDENKKTLEELHSNGYKVYVNDTELDESNFNAILDEIENYNIVINESKKTINLKQR